jgi:uncharacterized phage infection (PIP) family protein YhgE
MTNEIPKELIENALFLTEKTPWDMKVIWKIDEKTSQIIEELSIEKFFYYTLSKEFIEEYSSKILGE